MDFSFFPFQERLSYIGPEEFVQAFVQKDPLDNDKVTSACFSNDTSADNKAVVMQSFFFFFLAKILGADLISLRLL